MGGGAPSVSQNEQATCGSCTTALSSCLGTGRYPSFGAPKGSPSTCHPAYSMIDPNIGSGENSPIVEIVSPGCRPTTAIPCAKLCPGSGGKGLRARTNSSLTLERLGW